MGFNKTRIAPTPSGFLHVGNAASFLLTSRLAAAHGARVLLRIDDMDRGRVNPAYVEDVFDTLAFLGIGWDEGPLGIAAFETEWSQVFRIGLYEAALSELRGAGLVFACNCSRSMIERASVDGEYPGTCRDKALPLDAEGVVWRVRTEGEGGTDAAAGLTEDGQRPVAMRDFIVRKKDGFPAYQVCSLVDDIYFGVDLIVRGEDLRPSSEAQRFLARFLPGGDAFLRAHFIHHPLLMDGNGEHKLSKSAGATSIRHLRAAGMSAAEVVAMIERDNNFLTQRPFL